MKSAPTSPERPAVAPQRQEPSAEPSLPANVPAGTQGPRKGQLTKTQKEAASRAEFEAKVLPMHTPLIGQSIYRQQLKSFRNDEALDRTAIEYVGDVMKGMKTGDPFEQMLVMQAIWTHARLAHLSGLANQQTNSNHLKILNDACDRAANTFRRQMLALVEYRRPPRTDAFVAIKQANVAQQQVIANGQNPNSTKAVASNEVGSSAPALLPHTERIDFPAAVGAVPQAVAVEHRPQDDSGQGPRQDERHEARRA